MFYLITPPLGGVRKRKQLSRRILNNKNKEDF